MRVANRAFRATDRCEGDLCGRTGGARPRASPRLVLVIPHLGMDEYDEYDDYARLTNACDRLHLDTTMAIARYFEKRPSSDVFPGCAARLHYGTDFPNLLFAWDRELKRILAEVPAGPIRGAILWDNAAQLFGT